MLLLGGVDMPLIAMMMGVPPQFVIGFVIGAAIGFVPLFLVFRWCLSIGRMVRALEGIDESLRCMPAVRARDAALAAQRAQRRFGGWFR